MPGTDSSINRTDKAKFAAISLIIRRKNAVNNCLYDE
jgi:hypothetical protein